MFYVKVTLIYKVYIDGCWCVCVWECKFIKKEFVFIQEKFV